ncbi:MAG: AAA family ATPase [Nakamurella sp.]
MTSAPMVGRESEIRVLLEAVASVTAGERRLVLVRGEAGIGKTRLLTELSGVLGGADYTVLQGRATELESDVPFAPVLEAFHNYPDLQLNVVAAQAISPGDRWKLYRAVSAALDDSEPAGPVALILDDMHWADPVTLEFLEHCIRRPPRRSLLLVLGLRPGVVGEHLLDAQRMTNGGAVVVQLAALDSAAADSLMLSITTPADRARIFAQSGGNPMFIEELVRMGVGDLQPGALTDHVQVELRRASRSAAELLRAGALIGDPFDVDVAGAASGLGPGEITEALDDLAERSFVRPIGGRQFTFRHPVVRTAILTALPPGRRLALHSRIAQVLAENAAPLPARARHLSQSASAGDLAAALVLRGAAAAVRPQAPAIAADWLLAAQRADPAGDPAVQAVLAETLVDAGRLDQALQVTQEALADPASPDSLRLILVEVSVERLVGRHDAARRRLQHALQAQDQQGPAAARLFAELAVSAYESGAFDEFGPFAERALGLPAADHLVRSVSLLLLAVTQIFTGDQAAAKRGSDDAIRIISTVSDAELATHAELLIVVPWALLSLERLTDILTTGRRTADAARRAGNSSAAVAQELAVLLALGLTGRIRECVDAADRAEQSARTTFNDQIVQWSLWMRAWALLERGNVQTAHLAATESVEIARRLDDSSLVTVATAVLGATLVAAGEPGKGRPMLAAYDLDPGWVCRWAPILVEADLALGDLVSAGEHADRATALANTIGLAGPRAYAARAAGMTALAAGEAEAAHSHSQAAIAAAESIGATLEVARCRLLAGRALAASDRAGAIAELEAAARMADDAGAERVRDAAVRELRRLGRRVGRGGQRAPGGGELGELSPREREIAELVADGLTNKEIAGRLFLSGKTVESHLSRTFAKLDVRSRAALATKLGAASRADGADQRSADHRSADHRSADQRDGGR